MYIKELFIDGFRNFKDIRIPFHEGLNILIGHNNAGKSNLLSAIALVLSDDINKKLQINDFSHKATLEELQSRPPKIEINLVFEQSEGEPADSEEIVALSEYTINTTEPYEIQLNYEYYLPTDYEEEYLRSLAVATDTKHAWRIIDREFIRLYKYRRWGGNTDRSNTAKLDKFDFQFLDAIRDVNRDMYAGYSKLLRELLDFFIDYEVKSSTEKTKDEILAELRTKNTEFKDLSEPLMENFRERMAAGQHHILEYAVETGAAFDNASPDFDGELTESELFSALKLILKYPDGMEIPVVNNGLGYNNLIYMSMLLAKMQASSDRNYMKRESKLFPILSIEEPEAHLHPSMQYKFLKFLRESRQDHHLRQIFITTHSTEITSAASIDDIICMHRTIDGNIKAGCPRLIFSTDGADIASKKYIQRFLDATKSDMFFADKVIFVEGIAEQLLIPTFAHYLGIDFESLHIQIINLGGRYFEHFVKLFNTANFWGINRKIACITDIDPVKKSGTKFIQCYPFEYGKSEGVEYRHNADDCMERYADHPNIHYFRQDEVNGKTLEYDLMWNNADSDILLIEGLSNKAELEKMIECKDYESAKAFLRKTDTNKDLADLIDNCGLPDNEKRQSLIAARYLNSIGKGENALDLSMVLEENLKKEGAEKKPFTVPKYIEDALRWLLS